MKLRLLIAAASFAMLQAHIHENYVHATDHGFYGESHGTGQHVNEDRPHFQDGFGNEAEQHIHIAPKEGTKARECEDTMWPFAESDNLTYQQEENLRRVQIEGVHKANLITIVPQTYYTPFGYEDMPRWGFEDALWQYRTPMFPKLCQSECQDQEEIHCLMDECFVRTDFCCHTQCVPRDINRRLAYMFTSNLPTEKDKYVVASEIDAVIDTLTNTLANEYEEGVVAGSSLSWRAWGNTETPTTNRTRDNFEEIRRMAQKCVRSDEMDEETSEYPELTYDTPYPSADGERKGVTPRNFARCIHAAFKTEKEWRMRQCKWDTPVIKRSQPFGTKFTFRRRTAANQAEIDAEAAILDSMRSNLAAIQLALTNCEAGRTVNDVQNNLPYTSADGAITVASYGGRRLAASIGFGTGGVTPCNDEEGALDAMNAMIADQEEKIKALEIADPDIVVTRVECPICFFATGCPSTPPGILELDNPGKYTWCSTFVQYSRCLFYPDPLPPADDVYSEDDKERREAWADGRGMWLWERDANMYDNLDKCQVMPRTSDALHTCRCAFGYTSKYGGNPGISNPCIALPHDHHHHGHHGEHGNEPIPEVEEPAYQRPGYTLDREYDIVTYQTEQAVPLDDREHNQEFWGYEEGHGLVNYGHLRPVNGYMDDSDVHVADDNAAYDQNDNGYYDNRGSRYGPEGYGDFFHAPGMAPNTDDAGSGGHGGRWGVNRGSVLGGWGGDWGWGVGDNDNDNDGGYGSIFDGFPMFRGARRRGFGSSCCTIIGMAFMAMGVFLLSFYA